MDTDTFDCTIKYQLRQVVSEILFTFGNMSIFVLLELRLRTHFFLGLVLHVVGFSTKQFGVSVHSSLYLHTVRALHEL